MVTKLAKLSRPRLSGVHARERLFARLDECRRDAAALWLWGPPGVGKTTLAASWLDARELRALWYQVDAGDADPASFFYHLGLGAQGAGLSKKVHLPLLTPESLPDLGGFTRRWFRALCAGLPQPSVLVFDNVHEAPPGSPLALMLREALGELPAGTHALLVSRDEPPAEHARLRASRTLAELGWPELRLSADEAAHIAAEGRALPALDTASLLQRCDGWAAGLTLLLEHARATGGVSDAPQTRQALFDYFAAELFDRLPSKTQRLLLRTALLPWISVAMAETLADDGEAGAVLEGLRRKHLFTERRAGTPPSYQYHALFREFLQQRLQQGSDAHEQSQLASRSARLLAEAAQPDAALPLYLQAGDTQAAVRLVLQQAPQLAAQGRLQTLAAWIAALPAATTEALPWLGYWLGMCQLGRDPPAARVVLEAAFERFEAGGDALGQAVAVAAILETHNIEFHDFTRLDPWIDRLGRLLSSPPPFPDPAFELAVYSSMLGAMTMRRPEPALLELYSARVRLLLDAVHDVNARVGGAIRLLQYHTFMSDLAAGDPLVAYIQLHLSDPRLLPHVHVLWLYFESFWFEMHRYDELRGNRAVDTAIDLMERNDLSHFAVLLRARAAQFCLERGDTQGAARHLAQAVPTLEGHNDTAWHFGVQSWLSMLRGDHEAAVANARVLVRDRSKAGLWHGDRMALLLLANALGAAGKRDEAFDAVAQSRTVPIVQKALDTVTADCIEAELRLDCGESAEAGALVRQAFSLARRDRLFNTLQWLAPQMSRLCAFALERDIEPAYVTELIRLRGLQAPSPQVSVWPWPIKLHTLGRFELLRDGAPLRFEGGKAQRKPLALLKALVALGGSDVEEDALIDIVWPEGLDGDEQKALDITLHRLRKLLGHDHALRVSDRRVSLDRMLVWVDLWALEHRLSALVPLAPAALPEPVDLERAAPAILTLYRGHFLDGEADRRWLLPVRNRLDGRFQRYVLRLGEHWENASRWSQAAQLYERVIELDPLAEAFYVRQMACLAGQGRRAEAIEVYRRLRRLLSVTLGVEPGEAAEATYRGLFA